MNKGFETRQRLLQAYLGSSRLYLSPDEMAIIRGGKDSLESAERALDLSDVPPALISESSRRLAMQLKEILDRIEIPPIETVPDAQAMADAEFKRWTLSNSEIRIARVQKGLRTGEYLFSPETVQRLPEFYLKVKHLPYPDARKDNIQVVFHDFGPHSLDILLNFFVKASSRAVELSERQRILLDILRLAEAQGVQFAFPTQTLHIESLPKEHSPAELHSTGIGKYI